MGFGLVEHNVNMKFNRNLLFGAGKHTHMKQNLWTRSFQEKKYFGIFLWFKSFVLFRREAKLDENLIRCAFGMTENKQHNNLCFRRSYSIISALEAPLERIAARVEKTSLGFYNTLKIPSQHAIPLIPIHVEAIFTSEKIENSCYSLLFRRKKL